MRQSNDVPGTQLLDYEAWRETLRAMCGRYNPRERRASLRTEQPLGEIAYACGFRDYSHFARRFRKRFGYPAGAYGGRYSRGDQEKQRHSETEATGS
jgi:hypothetical protein